MHFGPARFSGWDIIIDLLLVLGVVADLVLPDARLQVHARSRSWSFLPDGGHDFPVKMTGGHS